MSKTNTEVLGKSNRGRESSSNGKGGRPKVSRELVIRNLKVQDHTGAPRYTYAQIARIVNCSTKTIKRIAKKAREDGELPETDRAQRALGIVEADFDSECERAMGYGFREWLNTKFKRKGQANYVFNFNAKLWDQYWDKCSMVEFADTHSNLADRCAIAFLTAFKDDAKRMRNRLKLVRNVFRFAKRGDVCEAHLKMSSSKHPRAKRKVPEISFTDFPKRLMGCIDQMAEALGEEARLLEYFKIATQMRTGAWSEEGDIENRELFGISVQDPEANSYIIMKSSEEYQIHVYAKRGETWDIFWLPKLVRDMLWEHYQTREYGEPLFSLNVKTVLKYWRRITKAEFGRSLKLHDMRKVSITWFYVLGVPLEVAAMMNVGWKDMSTATTHYLDIKPILRRGYRAEYAKEIPDWFKDGLGEYMGHEATVPSHSSSFSGTPSSHLG